MRLLANGLRGILAMTQEQRRFQMQRAILAMVATVALALALAFPAGAGARTEWVCVVGGEPEIFVSAGDAARHGIETANGKAGVVFQKFGEVCSVRVTH
jgi:hypothetical protein